MPPDETTAALSSGIIKGWKQRARATQPVAIDPHKLYSPSDVSALLNVSYDTAIRRMQTMQGCVDMGTKERRYKRGKRMLRISGKHLREYLTNKRVEI
ncbi:MAG TPA: hypothetical protein VK302_00140 [Terriglobales bacterium]|nr:hypothetical protein [Terriglobales bacterium]